ncbi:hypothetical protein CTAYLR_008701 [Chrysophaeum taylorii]|uniref:ABC transporter domain-containing protein n=1 Tax=Chrysophaeum taylorii TaxID=2483200 RepID=A0AAD7UJB5_9STRA|nr:hypothetical protein CTAYLR_008701 [Chrysophaeum taylorii]
MDDEEISPKQPKVVVVGVDPDVTERMSGRWKRVRTWEYQRIVRALGGGIVMQRLAAKMSMTHIIAMNARHFRLVEVGGPIKTDTIVVIGGGPATVQLQNRFYLQECYWEGDTLILSREHLDGDHELEFRRTLLPDSQGLEVDIIFRKTPEGHETRAKAWFERIGDAANLELPPEEEKSPPASSRSYMKQRTLRVMTPPFLAATKQSLSEYFTPRQALGTTSMTQSDEFSSFDDRRGSLLRHVSQVVRIEHRETVPVEICVSNVSYFVVGNSSRVQLLEGVTLSAKQSQTLALIGPSGSGKSTLMNVMLARTRGVLEGQVTYDGVKATARAVRSIAKLVPQDAVLEPTLTSYQTLELACALTLSPEVSREQVRRNIHDLLEKFGLADQKDVVVGNESVKGLSGGQRRRLSIALELTTVPSALFLDEPTSGLDSRTAIDVMTALQRMANEGLNVVCSIHQPPAVVFRSFDSLGLLAKGRMAYFGEVEAAESYFVARDYPPPVGENIAAHYLDVLVDHGATLADLWEKSARPREEPVDEENYLDEVQYAVSFAASTKLLFVHYLRAVLKNPRDARFRVKSSLVVGFITALCFVGLRNAQSWAVTHRSLVFLMLLYLFIGPVSQTAVVMTRESKWLAHEYTNARFPFVSWYVARLGVLGVTQTIYSFIYVTIVYVVAGLRRTGRGEFLWFLAIATLHSIASGLQGFLIGTFASSVEHANALLGPTLLPNVLFSGFLFTFDECSNFFYPFWYASAFRYALEAATFLQFKYGNFRNCSTNKKCRAPNRQSTPSCATKCPYGPGTVPRVDFLNTIDMQTNTFYFNRNVLILSCFILLLAIIIFFAGRRKLSNFEY